MTNDLVPERFDSRMVRNRMMRKDAGVVEDETVSLAPRVAAELMKISRTLELGSRGLNRNGRRRIGRTQGRILVFLLSRSHDRVMLTNLAKGTALSSATVSEAVKELKARGWVRKARSRDDARVVYLSLSAAGRRKAAQAAAGSKHLRAAIGRLPQKEQQLVLHTLQKIQLTMNHREKKP